MGISTSAFPSTGIAEVEMGEDGDLSFIIKPKGPPSHLFRCFFDSFHEARRKGETKLRFHTCTRKGWKGIILANESICAQPMIVIVPPAAEHSFDAFAKLHEIGTNLIITPVKGHGLRFTFVLPK